jgi:acetylglutamate synthase
VSAEPRELVLRFLSSIGRPNESEQYLALFRASPAFAILHVSDAVATGAADVLAVDLRLLANLGLRPVLVFGAAPGNRRGGARAHADAILAALEDDVPASIVTPAEVPATIEAGRISLVPLAAPTIDARFDELAAMASALGTRKLVFLGRRSGLQPDRGPVVSLVDLAIDPNPLAAALPPQQAALLRQIGRLVDRIGHRVTVSVTSPLDLLRELFTVKGAGTLVRRGARVVRYRAWDDLDGARLVALVEEAFARPLIADLRARPLASAYVADDYRGAAIVTDTPLAPYLSKFAVTTVARGEGVGGDLWRVLAADYPRLYWRSRAGNPITAWYREQCDGLVRMPIDGAPWVVLWRGLEPAEIPAAIAYCASSPPDFE